MHKLYCFRTNAYEHNRICDWIEAQDIKFFVYRLSFNHSVSCAIQQFQRLDTVIADPAPEPYPFRLDSIEEEVNLPLDGDGWWKYILDQTQPMQTD
ncbi:hypothetical protein LTS10_012128 [Elasticomyces elasticus]|nr:hypothetical protein LTS10_012128 [Elasticomyces elasticus]